MKSLLPRRRRLYCSYESVVNTSRAGPCCRHFPPRARVSSAGRLATSMPSLAAHLGVREPRRTRGDASPRPPSSSSPGASVRLPSTEPTQDAEPASETRTPERSHPAPRAQTPGVVPRVISRRGSLVARRNSTLASVAERLAEESRELRDEAFDVPTLDVPDPPATHLPTFRGKPRERTYRQPDGTLDTDNDRGFATKAAIPTRRDDGRLLLRSEGARDIPGSDASSPSRRVRASPHSGASLDDRLPRARKWGRSANRERAKNETRRGPACKRGCFSRLRNENVKRTVARKERLAAPCSLLGC